ncbi:MAG TPA: DUF1700 domain-containing protein, partial [Vicinamibacterales bacterium]|nr:DUF1700 domain-containing protein [Vicinamibacterales bacterium]
LAGMAPTDRAEVVQEIRNHIAEAVAAGKPIDVVLTTLGPADALARGYAVELLLHPKSARKSSGRVQRVFTVVGLVALMSIPTLVIVTTLGSIGVSFVISGFIMFVIGIAASIGELPYWVRMDVPPIFAIAGGPLLAALGIMALVGLVAYVKFLVRAMRRVLPRAAAA